jgi:UDP-N-acetylmuramate: L-alanyl-gamma-D-glutamyl-meso-diaminopimelate ligase
MVLVNGDDANCVEVAKDCLAQMIEVGFSKNCAQRIRDVASSAEGSRFKLGDETFEIPLVGEFNVHNAAMAAMAARFYDVPKAKIDSAFKTFAGIARRQEIRGEARGVKVIDDFGHHPPRSRTPWKHCAIAIEEIGCGPFSNRAPTQRDAQSFNSSFPTP